MSGVKGRSGRKPRREQFAAIYETTEREMHGLLSAVPQALRDLIEGVFYESLSADGEMRIYQKEPNVRAIEILLNRTMGDVKKKVELSGDVNVGWLDLQRELQKAIEADGEPL